MQWINRSRKHSTLCHYSVCISSYSSTVYVPLSEYDDRDSLKTLNMLYVHSYFYFYFDSGQFLRTFLTAETVSTSFATTVYFKLERKLML